MKERPIIFSGGMVKALLDGTKTQTRRIVKPQPSEFFRPSEVEMYSPSVEDKDGFLEPGPEIFGCYDKNGENEGYKFPYGVVGRRLWVRETFAENVAGCPGGISYRADHQDPQGDGPSSPLRWKPSIHMPHWASRITLEITKVRVERLQDISDADILAEGLDEQTVPRLLSAKAARQDVVPEHWVHGADEGISYCRECCEKEVARLLKKEPDADYCVDGGWGIEGDSIPSCEICHRMLSNSLTDYGAEQEFAHFLENGCDLRSPDDCYCLLTAAESQMWTMGDRFASDRDYQHEDRIRRNWLYHKLAWRVFWDSLHGKDAWEKNPWVWVLEFKRHLSENGTRSDSGSEFPKSGSVSGRSQ